MGGQRVGDQGPVEHEQSVDVMEGETFDLVVDDLPGAGYRWVVRSLPTGLVLLDEDADRTSEPQTAAVGGGVRRTLRLRAEATGSHRVELVFVRPWEPPEVAPARLRIVVVTVTAS